MPHRSRSRYSQACARTRTRTCGEPPWRLRVGLSGLLCCCAALLLCCCAVLWISVHALFVVLLCCSWRPCPPLVSLSLTHLTEYSQQVPVWRYMFVSLLASISRIQKDTYVWSSADLYLPYVCRMTRHLSTEMLTLLSAAACFKAIRSQHQFGSNQEEISSLRGAPLPLDRDQGLCGCFLKHRVT